MSKRESTERRKRITAKGIRKVYRSGDDAVTALEDMNIEVFDREFFCLLGPSGCGKSTFLRIVGGLLEKDGGSLNINKDGFDPNKPLTNMVFQERGIFPWKTVIENVSFGLKMRGVGKGERHRIAQDYIDRVNLAGFEDSYPHQLSGGMKQRVGIARAFTNDPEILLMDEPFGALDAQTKEYLQSELLSLWNDAQKTVLYVTHDIDEAILLGDRLGIMTARPGKVKDVIEVDFDRPRSKDSIPAAEIEEVRSSVWASLSEEVEQSIEEAQSG